MRSLRHVHVCGCPLAGRAVALLVEHRETWRQRDMTVTTSSFAALDVPCPPPGGRSVFSFSVRSTLLLLIACACVRGWRHGIYSNHIHLVGDTKYPLAVTLTDCSIFSKEVKPLQLQGGVYS